MDAFDFRNEQMDRILDMAETPGGQEFLFRELLARMSNGELKEFADDMAIEFKEELA